MPLELGFRKSQHLRANNTSPDSLRCNSSVVSSSSASASINRSSFASNFQDRDSSASDTYQHLAGYGSGGESLSGLDPDPDKHFTMHEPRGFTGTRHHKDKAVQKQDIQSNVEEDLSTDSTPVSFSLALKDCQDRRSKINVQGKKRNSKQSIVVEVKSSSPRLEALKKSSHPSRPSSEIHSPATPTYQSPSVSMQKGWNSERMPLPHKGNRVGPALLPLSNVKALPSKWEDAERWIFSPAFGDSSHRQPVHQHQLHKKPKAKSGPLGPPGSAYYSMYTPVVQMSNRRSVGDLMAGSPFLAGLKAANGLSTLCDDLGKGSPARLEPWMPRSISLHGCSVEIPCHSSLPSSRDEEVDNMNDKAKNISCPVSRRDIASQISLADSTSSSFIRMSSACNEEEAQSSYLEIRDVEDKKVTIGSLRSIHRANQSGRSSGRVDDCMKKTMVPQSLSWACAETVRLGRSTRDESRITAWENLQKAKAEAAIQKLEIKMEKKKGSSMDKIMKKLKTAQKKAQEMRKSMSASQIDHTAKPSSHRSSSMHKVRQKSSLSGCFTCHAFHLP